MLSFLPLHAAGHHHTRTHTTPQTVMDRAISSYTPTIRALIHARRPPAPSPPGTPPALIVSMPTTPGLPGSGPLPHAADEARNIAARIPGAITLTDPDPASPASDQSAAPTLAAVLTRLATCPIAHFACHGTHDPAEPSRSRLLLHDHQTAPLTVTALTRLRLDHARLAYLSACHTAISAQLPDETIHLASAFQLAGYPHVIGTLWAINDYIAAKIADTFYASTCAPCAPSRASCAALLSCSLPRDPRTGPAN